MRVENYKLFSDLYNDYSPCSLIQILSTTRKLIDKRILYFISLTIEQDEYQKVIEISNLDITFKF